MMTSRRRRCAARWGYLALAVLGVSSKARAEERTEPWSYPWSIDAQLSSPLVLVDPAPYGWLGASMGYSPARWLAIDAGAGVGYLGPKGTLGYDLAVMPRFRVAFQANKAIDFGAGVSTGKYWWNETPFDSAGATKSWDWAIWANMEVSYEWRAASGFELRPYLGLARLLNPGAGICGELVEHCRTVHAADPSGVLPYFGMAIGRAFDN